MALSCLRAASLSGRRMFVACPKAECPPVWRLGSSKASSRPPCRAACSDGAACLHSRGSRPWGCGSPLRRGCERDLLACSSDDAADVA
eukprot:3527595-Pyramimonas_sp.AAC.1